MLEAVQTVYSKYATFEGRARRSEYWWFSLFFLIVYLVLYALGKGDAALAGVFVIGSFLPSLAVTVRRLHDTNRSGWWMLIGLIPFIGGIIMLVFTVQDSDDGPNQYGPNPKGDGLAPTTPPAHLPPTTPGSYTPPQQNNGPFV